MASQIWGVWEPEYTCCREAWVVRNTAGSTGMPRVCMVHLGEHNMVHQAEVQGVRQAALLVVLLEVRRGVLREIQGVLAAVLVVEIHQRGCPAGFLRQRVRRGSLSSSPRSGSGAPAAIGRG